MGKKNNVNPDHYKEAGRERPGQDIVQEIHKQKFAQTERQNAGGSKFIPGGAPVLNESPAADAKSDVGQINESANSSSNT
jgi:hypothetical protein